MVAQKRILMKKITLLFLCILFFSHNNTVTQNDIFVDVRAGNKQAVKKRLENCEDCAVRADHGNNALHVAAQEGNDEIIEILTTNLSYADFSSWLYSWFSAPTLPDINEINDDGDSPLLCTMYKGDLESAKCLVNKGASIEIVNKKGFSAPFVAMIKDDPRFIPIFVAHTLNLDHHRRNGDTIFHAAIKEKKPNVIHYCARETALSNSLNKDNKTPVFLAIDTE